jgi:ABC-2 type transport system ATP-binding protein
MTTTAIEVEHLTKSYGTLTAVHDISFTVGRGEVMCLLGPNGAGKTTTTEILEGYRERTDGSVSVLGFDPGRHERAFRQRIGIVHQECGVQDDLTVGEVLDMYGSYAARRIPTAEVIRLVELEAKACDRVRHLSGGQRRRLDVGLALVGDPDLVFLDEPTTGFDPAARRASWSMFRSLTELGKTVLLTTHFMDEAEALADRIAVVADGRIIAEGTPDDLGGRALRRTTITAVLPADTRLDDLPVLDGGVHLGPDGRLVVDTADGVAVTHALTDWAIRTGITLDRLNVTQPSLEDVYLALTNDTATRTETLEPAR